MFISYISFFAVFITSLLYSYKVYIEILVKELSKLKKYFHTKKLVFFKTSLMFVFKYYFLFLMKNNPAPPNTAKIPTNEVPIANEDPQPVDSSNVVSIKA